MTILIKFSALLTIMVQPHSCNKKLRLTFCKSKSEMQGLSYVGPNTWNKLPNNP